MNILGAGDEHERMEVVMLIDLQVDYISGGDMLRGQRSPLLEAFPELPNNVATLLGKDHSTPLMQSNARWQAKAGRPLGRKAGWHLVFDCIGGVD